VGELESLQALLNEVQVLTDEERILQVRQLLVNTIVITNIYVTYIYRPLVLTSRLISLNTEKQNSYFQKPLKILTRFQLNLRCIRVPINFLSVNHICRPSVATVWELMIATFYQQTLLLGCSITRGDTLLSLPEKQQTPLLLTQKSM